MNPDKLTELDALASVYLTLCQHYVTLFCNDKQPDKFCPPIFHTPLSERWHRVAIQQAAGIAQSWRTNREQAYQGYLEEVAEYREQQTDGTLDAEAKEPVWTGWDVPALQQICIEVRSWTGWYRHVTLSLVAQFCATLMAEQASAELVWHQVVAHAHVIAWSFFRRHHQAVAKACHSKRREAATPA